MPNGLGGIPRFGSPVALLAVLLFLFWLRTAGEIDWTIFPAALVGALFAWRLSWHIHMHEASAYSGGHTSDEDLASARKWHRLSMAALIPLVLLAVLAAW